MAEDTSSQNTKGGELDDQRELDLLADRLEAALDRIVRQVAAGGSSRAVPDRRTKELARRLDGLIGRLRVVLGEPIGHPPE
jgi:hypothetical protein